MLPIGEILSGTGGVLLTVVDFLRPLEVEVLRLLSSTSRDSLRDVPCLVKRSRQIQPEEWIEWTQEDWDNIIKFMLSNKEVQLEIVMLDQGYPDWFPSIIMPMEEPDCHFWRVFDAFESNLDRFWELDNYRNWRLKCGREWDVQRLMKLYEDPTGHGRDLLFKRLLVDTSHYEDVMQGLSGTWDDLKWLVEAVFERLPQRSYFPRLERISVCIYCPRTLSDTVEWLRTIYAPWLEEVEFHLPYKHSSRKAETCTMVILQEDARIPKLKVRFNLCHFAGATSLVSHGALAGRFHSLIFEKRESEPSGNILPPAMKIPGVPEFLDWVDQTQIWEQGIGYANFPDRPPPPFHFDHDDNLGSRAEMQFFKKGEALALRRLGLFGGTCGWSDLQIGDEISQMMAGVKEMFLGDTTMEDEKVHELLKLGSDMTLFICLSEDSPHNMEVQRAILKKFRERYPEYDISCLIGTSGFF